MSLLRVIFLVAMVLLQLRRMESEIMRRKKLPFDMEDQDAYLSFETWVREQQDFRIVGCATINDLEPIALWLRAVSRCEVTLNEYYALFFKHGELVRYQVLPLWVHSIRYYYRQQAKLKPELIALRADFIFECLVRVGLVASNPYQIGDDNELPF